MDNLIARAEVRIAAPAAVVWEALTDPVKIKEYMFGAVVESSWEPGSPILWKGEFKGKAFEDKGEVLKTTPGRLLQYRHQDHIVTVELESHRDGTEVMLTQDHNPNEDARRDSEQNWSMMLAGLKKVVEA